MSSLINLARHAGTMPGLSDLQSIASGRDDYRACHNPVIVLDARWGNAIRLAENGWTVILRRG